ncbi:MAG: hypothetical protein H8E59_00405 [Actinobacteria bacterium]|nr:hypothetical protein [Actinomycetota bacterium]
MPNNKRHNEPLRLRFPFLWGSTATPDDFREDLRRTDAEFGFKWRRHKTARLAELQRHEDQLALVIAKERLSIAEPLLQQLESLGAVSDNLLDAVTTTPIDRRSAEAVFRSSSISLRPGVVLADHHLDAVLTDLTDLEPEGDLGLAIVRDSICTVRKPTTYQKLADEHGGITRQAVDGRRKTLVRRLLGIGERRALASLGEFLRNQAAERSGSLVMAAANPFTRIALLPHEGDFPDVVDAVKVGLWLASAGPNADRPPGFQAQPDGSLRRR